jgi:hypothetical protein
VPPVSASFELGIKDEILEKGVIGVGGYAGFASYEEEYSNYGVPYGWKHTVYLLGARGSFHYPFVDKLDTYSGLILGAFIDIDAEYGNSFAPGVPSTTKSRGLFSWFAGARYYFKDNLACTAEIGYGISYLNIGIAYKFN